MNSSVSSFVNLDQLDEKYEYFKDKGTSQIFFQYAERMLSTLNERVDALSNELEKKNLYEFGFLAHQLGGSFNAMGSSVLLKICKEIESAAKDNSYEKCKNLLVQLNSCINDFQNELSEVLDELKKQQLNH